MRDLPNWRIKIGNAGPRNSHLSGTPVSKHFSHIPSRITQQLKLSHWFKRQKLRVQFARGFRKFTQENDTPWKTAASLTWMARQTTGLRPLKTIKKCFFFLPLSRLFFTFFLSKFYKNVSQNGVVAGTPLIFDEILIYFLKMLSNQM